MKKYSQKIDQEFGVIKNTINNFSNGARIEEIKDACGLDLELRTLQRRIVELKDQGVVTSYGEKRATRYFLTVPLGFVAYEPEETYSSLQLSDVSQELLTIISRPAQQRKPVRYNPDFLASYRPNIDHYLTPYELNRLWLIGRTKGINKPAGSYAREILNRLLIDLSYHSSRLEGNSYSLLETQRLISLGKLADGKSAEEAQMILNHKDAIKFLVEGGNDGPETGFNRYTIFNLHALLAYEFLKPKSCGRLRNIEIGIYGSAFTPLQIPQQIEIQFELILEKVQQIENPIEQAFFILVHFPYLQPFEDVNKRVSRLAANIPLNQHNLSPLSFIDVPHDMYIKGILAVYELNRVELLKDIFLWAYERSALQYAAVRQTCRTPDPFNVKYREGIRAVVTSVVTNALSQESATRKIKEIAQVVPKEDQSHFIERVDITLLSLHEGNIGSYWISLNQYYRWREIWEKG
ncbi:MAG TPA: Fic family protein [Niastella sp.]